MIFEPQRHKEPTMLPLRSFFTREDGAPKSTEIIDQVQRCRRLYNAIQHPRGQPNRNTCWTEIEKAFLADYEFSSVSKLRTMPALRQFVGYVLSRLEDAFAHPGPLQDGIWCEALVFSFERAQQDAEFWIKLLRTTLCNRPLGYESVQFILSSPEYAVPGADCENELSGLYRDFVLDNLRKRYPKANAVLQQRLADARVARWRMLHWHKRNMSTDGEPIALSSYRPEGFWPQPPALPAGAKEVLCPYCADAIPVAICEPERWKAHVLYDFHPYICMHEECNADAAFASTEDWNYHMCCHAWEDEEEACPLCKMDLPPGSARHLTEHLEEEIMSIQPHSHCPGKED
ncbi:uncharacterized protein BO97DRAFT_453900 [Aspergillus homomorphus CBS 101889]|uniref:Uncharacterized protein n=1 Tax=Aspergillus homomorphus (strain CBS 101889) TaxID=1450537 RepID=A0A395HWE3_ASPHC|nr:hypothetical protein BO97DRAFT_453900 [Aspergillus homomorphus CBS 101889]RAL11745.1 hypothetical protein BO97DRAFT_453900 [Aspergillus homomorphus CBS 101889]